MAPAIPDRWIPYKPFGSVIEGTRLICFKVPLRKSVQEDCRRQGIKIEEMWDIETLLENIPNLSIVIDLTNTARYYDPRVFEAAGVHHVKICLPGRTMPPEQTVTQFCDTVERFLQNNADGLVGVHCTHGLNRTGYMVCRYLRDRLGIPAEKAIEIFESARGYKIERENYLAGIRGKEVPPPEFGNDTVLMPIEEESGRYVRRRRDNRSNGYRRERDGTHGDTSRSRDRSPLRERESGTRRRHNNGNTRDMQREKRRRHDDEYDYRYDY